MHRLNAAGQAIQTCKNHFVSGLSTTNTYLPISEWYRLLFQCLITLNLLYNYRVNPALSAYAYLYGTYNFNKYPMEKPRTCVIIYVKPGNPTSWGHHGTPAWYIGP